MAKRAIVTITYDSPFALGDSRVGQEFAVLTRRDIQRILVDWMGWEPVDVQSFWLICAKLRKREHPGPFGYRRPYLVKTTRGTFRVEGAFCRNDAAAIVCKAESCARSAIEWVKPVLTASEGQPRPAMRGGASVPPWLAGTQRKTRP